MAWIVLPEGTQRLLSGQSLRIGRDNANDLTLEGDSKISRSHAELSLREDQWVLIDLGSSNGTKVNGHRIEQHALRNGDQIQLGATILVFVAQEDPNATDAETNAGKVEPRLSARERQVLALLAEGLTDRDIAERLFISASTVRSHLDRIGERTGLRRRAELTRLALELGIS